MFILLLTGDPRLLVSTREYNYAYITLCLNSERLVYILTFVHNRFIFYSRGVVPPLYTLNQLLPYRLPLGRKVDLFDTPLSDQKPRN